MALAHKELDHASIPWRFTEKHAIAPHGSERVPVLLHGEKPVVDSWVIANYLEDHFPDRPSLFGGDGRCMSWRHNTRTIASASNGVDTGMIRRAIPSGRKISACVRSPPARR
jgi:glutathione S-transferase